MIDQPTTYNEEIYLLKDKVMVILSDPWDKIEEADRQLLQKILQSVRLNLASVNVMYNPSSSGLEVKAGDSTVSAAALSKLQNDPAAKQKLWVALKQLFGM